MNALSVSGDASHPSAFRRLDWLDGLRGLAILVVLLFHINLLKGGFLGVDLFFVLSGFLITTLLVKEWQRSDSIHLGRFYLRRLLRLAPAFVCTLLAFNLCIALTRPELLTGSGKQSLVALAYLSNWRALHGVDLGMLVHTWSLSLEEQFYLVWPVLLLVVLKLSPGRKTALTLVAIGIVASAGTRLALCGFPPQRLFSKVDMTLWRVYEGLDTRADALLVGCFVGMAYCWELLPRSGRLCSLLKCAALMAIAPLMYAVAAARQDEVRLYQLGLTLIALFFGIALAGLLASPWSLATRFLAWRPLVGLGRISYSLYLVHVPVIGLIFCLWPACPPALRHVVEVVTSFAVALALYFGVEKPFLRLKSRFTEATAADQPQAPRHRMPQRLPPPPRQLPRAA